MVRCYRMYLVLLAMIMLSAGCSSPPAVSTDYDPDYNFSDKKTFAVTTPEDVATTSDDLTKERIAEAIVKEMNKKGFTEVQDSEADLLVSYFSSSVKTQDLQTYETYNNHWGYGQCLSCFMATPNTEVRSVDYVAGALFVDMIDPATKKLRWRGHVEAKIRAAKAQRLSVKERTNIINNAVSSILDTYPPNPNAAD